MYTLSNAFLTVEILDPVADQKKLGSRFCTGGYIWQIKDSGGDLLSGPAYPSAPRPFDGQGLPDAFEIALGQDRALVGDEVEVLGVGRVKRTSSTKPFHVRDNPEVIRFCVWEIEDLSNCVRMRTSQQYREQALFLTREVRLTDRRVQIHTRLQNVGEGPLPIRFFAHPFFPFMGPGQYFRPSLECSLPVNPGYFVDEAGWLVLKSDFNWRHSLFQLINVAWGYPVSFEVKHPRLDRVQMECGFPLSALPIWSNGIAVSIEPFLHTTLPPGREEAWSLTYRL